MNETKYKWILYTIIAVIVGTIGIQFYWNYKNYEINKQQLINDVQLSLDNAIEKYYAKLAEQHTIGLAFQTTHRDSLFVRYNVLDSIMKKVDYTTKGVIGIDSLDITLDSGEVSFYRGLKADSLLKSIRHDVLPKSSKKSIEINHLKFGADTLSLKSLNNLTSKVVISMTNDTLKIAEIDSLFGLEIFNRNLNIEYKLKQVDIHKDSTENYLDKTKDLYIVSKSPFLTPHNQIIVSFSNSTKEILRRGLTGIFISIILILVVIGCLFYLLNIIKHQKQLAEVKNDLISNITHEFKTPIATIGVALESIKDFNVIEDKKKTSSYLDMSKIQLSKLNEMVEKLLETATLDSEDLTLNKEKINIVELIQSLVKKHVLSTSKNLNFNSSKEEILAKLDMFHFENAINNVIDNALKYGGKNITISITDTANGFLITISDDGTSLTNAHKQKIFEKFYRVPKGNTHDVKGFGIGLYYTKKIIEKHKGSIHLDVSNALTTFKIMMPYE